jgi:hypothetical protein
MRRTNPSIPTQMPLFPLTAGIELSVELPAPQLQELIRVLAELLLRAAATARRPAQRGGRDDER